LRAFINRAMQFVARRRGYAVVLEKLPPVLPGDLAGSKTDTKYLEEISRKLVEMMGETPSTLVEVGANYAQDAVYLSELWGLSPAQVVVFEPHPHIFARVAEAYSFQGVNAACGNFDGHVTLRAVRLDAGNSGISSLRDHSENAMHVYDNVDVPITRLDTFMADTLMAGIDFLKIDVEGLSFEVLEGLGSRLSDVTAIQLETETLEVWRDQHIEEEVFELLTSAGFQLVHYTLNMDGVQADSLWIQRRRVRHRIYDLADAEWRERPAP